MRKRSRMALLIAALLLLSTALTLAGSTGGYHIPWDSYAGGGDRSTSTHYGLNASAGEATGEASASTHYRLSSGFWSGIDAGSTLFLPKLGK